MSGFRPVDPRQSFPELEERVLERWRERDVFHRSLEQRARAPRSGASTRARRPRTGCWGCTTRSAGSSKISICRYRSMCGYQIIGRREARWDTHGLPVEIEVEKELGISSKQEIEEYGIAEFNDALPRVGLRVRRGVEPADRADRLLDRPRRPLRDPGERLHRVGLVVAAPALGRRPPLRGPQGRPLLPALRHGALLARGRARLPTTSRTPPSTSASRCAARRQRAGESLLVWTTTPVDAARQRGGRRRAGRHLRPRPRRRARS